ncbi:MAG: hypothetical protein HFI86_06625 [Bacilli bacterium]|nr:hypothetical protein [Bacilli bacterium]
MAYSKRIPPIKLVLTIKEYNNLIGVLTENINNQEDKDIIELAELTKEKLLKYSIPRKKDENTIEIDVRLYVNESADIISQLLYNIGKKITEVNYYQVLLKVRDLFDESNLDD